MKKYIFFLLSILCVHTLCAQLIFQEHTIIDNRNTIVDARSNDVADFDGDGDMDIVAVGRDDNKIFWYKNTDGLGNFSDLKIIATSESGPIAVRAADVDNDGFMDVITGSTHDGRVSWFRNYNGLGSFSPRRYITKYANGLRSIEVGDLDGDGDLDVISGSIGTNKVVWYENIDGQGTFGPTRMIVPNSNCVQDVYTFDMDGDNDLDIGYRVACSDTEVRWVENLDGQGNFGEPRFIENYIPNGVQFIDFDNDLDIDVVLGGYHYIAWRENLDGLGTLGARTIIIDNDHYNVDVEAVDLDFDGDLDIIGSSRSPDQLVWYENTDGLNYGSAQLIENSTRWAKPIVSADFNLDGFVDFVVSSEKKDNIIWYKNNLAEGASFSRNILTKWVDEPVAVFAADFNESGNVDVLVPSFADRKISWFKASEGEQPFENQLLLSEDMTKGFKVGAGDIDGDGDLDALALNKSHSARLEWFENVDGVLTTGASLFQEAGMIAFIPLDLDLDGDLDIVVANQFRRAVDFYENLDGLGNFSDKQYIRYLPSGVTNLAAGDIDGDGDIDLFSIQYTEGEIVMHVNTNGFGDFDIHTDIVNGVEGVTSINLRDIDSDGDLDLISTNYLDDTIIWYENLDGLGTFGPEQVIDNTVDGAEQCIAYDLDNDGDHDILFASYEDNTVGYFENLDGQGTFSDKIIISDEIAGASGVFAIDADSDLDVDIFAVSRLDNAVIYFENVPFLGIDEDPLVSVKLYPNPNSGELFILAAKSIKEIIIYSSLGNKVLAEENKTGIESVNIKKLASGIYFVSVKDGLGNISVKKIIKK